MVRYDCSQAGVGRTIGTVPGPGGRGLVSLFLAVTARAKTSDSTVFRRFVFADEFLDKQV